MFRTKSLYKHSSEIRKKVVVVTGCDSGLGYSIAHLCLKEGSQVLAGCLDPSGAGARNLQAVGARVKKLDVSNELSVSEMAAVLSSENLELHAVVNNAGVMVFGEFEWQTSHHIEQQIKINLEGPLRIARAFLPFLRRDHGRIINIASHCALAGLPGLSVYGATKAALLSWNDTLRIEQSKYGVRVISFIPGSFYGSSNIMEKQKNYAEEMLKEMPSDSKKFYQEYFSQVQSYLAQLPRPQGPALIEDEKLQLKLRKAIFDRNPRTAYKHEPIRYKIYHWLFKVAPSVKLRDYLIEKFVKLPHYKKSNS